MIQIYYDFLKQQKKKGKISKWAKKKWDCMLLQKKRMDTLIYVTWV